MSFGFSHPPLPKRVSACAGFGPAALQLKVPLSNREMLCWDLIPVFQRADWKTNILFQRRENKKKPKLQYLIFFQKFTASLNAGRFPYLIFLPPAVAS